MSYLIFTTKAEAEDRSREAWEAVLGRKKRPEDVTEFLWDRTVGKDGQTALVVLEHLDKLDAAEQAATVTVLPEGKGENWEKPSSSETGEIEA